MELERRHPVWARMFRRWQMAYDFWRGGIHITEPSHEATLIGWYEDLSDPDETDPEQGAEIGRRNWRTSWANSYLWKHERETINEYDYRQTRAINIPLYQYIVNTLSAGVLRSKPSRTGTGGWEETHKDIDMLGTDVDAFMRRALSLALVFGRIHAVTDRPSYETPALSRAEEMARGERAYAYLVTPLDLVDWAVDQHGRFTWVQIREDGPDLRAPGSEVAAPPDQYRIWYPDHWELWVQATEAQQAATGEKWVMGGSGEHSLGRVPVQTLYATRTNEAYQLECETPLADALDYNRFHVNKHSELDDADRMQTWSQLAVPSVDGSVGQIDIGPGRYFSYPAEGGAPSYLSPEPELLRGKSERMDNGIHTQRQLNGIGRGRAEYSKEERSAASISLESEDKQNQLAWWSKALNEFDNGVHRDLASWDGKASAPEAVYPTNYDVKATATQIMELVQLSAVPVMKSAMDVQAEAAKPILRKILGDGGATHDETAKVIDMLEGAVKKADEEKKAAAEAKKMPPGSGPFQAKPPMQGKGDSNAA